MKPIIVFFAASAGLMCFITAAFAGWHLAGLGFKLAVAPSWWWFAFNAGTFMMMMIALIRNGLPK